MLATLLCRNNIFLGVLAIPFETACIRSCPSDIFNLATLDEVEFEALLESIVFRKVKILSSRFKCLNESMLKSPACGGQYIVSLVNLISDRMLNVAQ